MTSHLRLHLQSGAAVPGGAQPELSGRLEDGTALPSSELAAPGAAALHCTLPRGKELSLELPPRQRSRSQPQPWSSGLLALGVTPWGQESPGALAACRHPRGGRGGKGMIIPKCWADTVPDGIAGAVPAGIS